MKYLTLFSQSLLGLVILTQVAYCEEHGAHDLAKLIADLHSDDFCTRKRATAEIKQFGESAVGAIKDSACSQDLETSRRSLAILRFWLQSEDRIRAQAANNALKELELCQVDRIRQAARIARRDAPENVIKRLEKRGVRFKYRNNSEVTGVDLSRQGIGNRDVAALHPFHQVESIDLDYTEITSEALTTFRNFSRLRELRMRCSCLQDGHLQSLQPLSKLEILSLWRTGLTDNGVKHLSPLVHLKELNLGHNDITDDSLKHLSRMKELTSLNLAHTGITDHGLQHLKSLRRLKFLNLKGTKVTRSGIEALKLQIGGLTVRWCQDGDNSAAECKRNISTGSNVEYRSPDKSPKQE